MHPAKAAQAEMLEELAKQMRGEIAKGYGDEEMSAGDMQGVMDNAKAKAMDADADELDLDDVESEISDEQVDDGPEPELEDEVRDFMRAGPRGQPTEGAMIVVGGPKKSPKSSDKGEKKDPPKFGKGKDDDKKGKDKRRAG